MAFEQPGFSFTLPAGADFSAGKQFRFADVSATGKAINPTDGGSVVGVRQTRSRADEATTIVHSGISIVEAGGAIVVGDDVGTNAVGQAVSGGNLGRALESATGAGIQIAVLLTPTAAAAPAV